MDESNASLAYLELEFSKKIYTIRKIKFQIFIEYAIKISEMKIQALRNDLAKFRWYIFSQKCKKKLTQNIFTLKQILGVFHQLITLIH